MGIQNYLNQIKNAVFGKDVRQSIHDAIKQCYDDASIEHDNANMEVKMARGSYDTLNDRLVENENNLYYKANKNEIFTMANMGQDIKESMTGGSVAVVGKAAIQSENIVSKQIQEHHISFIELGKNLFNKEHIFNGYINGIDGIFKQSNSYWVSDFIPILSNVNYVTRRFRYIAFYDSSYNLLPNEALEDEELSNSQTVINKNFTGFIRVSTTNTYLQTFQFLKGDKFENGIYNKYVFSMPSLIVDEKNMDDKMLKKINILLNKSILNLGDSIAYGAGSNGNGYGNIIAKKNNMHFFDYSLSGATISNINGKIRIESRLNEALQDNIKADYILFDGGINDAIEDRTTLGTISFDYTSDLDENTFCGAFEHLCRKLIDSFYDKKILYIRVHNMRSRSVLQKEYLDKAIDICNKYSIPYVDIYNEGGLNTNIKKMNDLYTNNADGTHPNFNGYELFYVPKIESKMITI